MSDTLFLKLFGKTPVTRVLDFLIDNASFEHTKTEIAREIGISRTTLHKIWKTLEEFEIVVETGRSGKAKKYRLNKKNPIVQKLIELDDAISRWYHEHQRV